MGQSLDRGIAILFLLKQKGSATLTEIAEEMGVHKSTVSRLVETLRGHDMVQVDPASKKYRLGYRMMYLGENVPKNTRMVNLARPFLFRLSEDLRESVHLCTFNNRTVYVVDQVRSSKAYSLAAAPGMVEPPHASSVGKCIFAWRPQDFVLAFLEENSMKAYTPNTITSPGAFLEHLAEVRHLGYAMDNEEFTMGVRCVAAPIFNRRGEVLFSVGASGPADEFEPRRVQFFAKRLMQAGWEISGAMGYRSHSVGKF